MNVTYSSDCTHQNIAPAIEKWLAEVERRAYLVRCLRLANDLPEPTTFKTKDGDVPLVKVVLGYDRGEQSRVTLYGFTATGSRCEILFERIMGDAECEQIVLTMFTALTESMLAEHQKFYNGSPLLKGLPIILHTKYLASL